MGADGVFGPPRLPAYLGLACCLLDFKNNGCRARIQVEHRSHPTATVAAALGDQ